VAAYFCVLYAMALVSCRSECRISRCFPHEHFLLHSIFFSLLQGRPTQHFKKKKFSSGKRGLAASTQRQSHSDLRIIGWLGGLLCCARLRVGDFDFDGAQFITDLHKVFVMWWDEIE
jgi:hypothetical protein